MAEPASESSELLRRAGDGDTSALGQLLDSHRARLRRMVKLRLDTRLQGRIDASDVLQEAYLEAAQRPAVKYRSLPARCRKRVRRAWPLNSWAG
jgi:DNA-directed RNA polymerase specialized sigma24 family protein